MTEPEIITCEQNSEEWFRTRLGIPTASMFDVVLASGRGGGESKTRATYMRKLAGEVLTNEPQERFTNGAMERGHLMEGEARDLYAFAHDVQPELVGFIRRGRTGASPDALVGESGLLEIKTKAPHILIEVLTSGEVPPEHVAQLQGALWVSGREWVDFVAYWPRLPLFVRRVTRDEAYIVKLAKAVAAFNVELDELVERIRSMGAAA